MVSTTSYRFLFRLVFVLCSLYLLGDAFFRWGGFSYYASFSEFLPSVALASILWSMAAVITAFVLWLLLRIYDWSCKKLGIKFNSENLMFCALVFLLSGALVWKSKKLIWPDVETSGELKIVVLFLVFSLSIFLSVLFRNKVQRWMNIIQNRITPLVWLFGIFVVLSLPLVIYHSWIKETGRTISGGQHQPYSTERHQPNIILVTYDSLTARNMSVYGYHKDTTPFINEWAKKATVFARTEAESNFTTSSTASLMTGKRVWSHGTFQIEGTPVKSDTESLPAVLKKNGYYNMAFVVNPHTSVEILGMAESFDIAPNASDFSEPASLVGWQFGYLDVFLHRLFGNKIRLHNWIFKNDFILKKLLVLVSSDFASTTVPPEKAFNRFLKVIDDNHQVPFFAWIHVFPPHDPYLPPELFKHFFSSSSGLRTFKKQETIKLKSYKYLFDHLRFPQEMQLDVDLLEDYYDEFLRYSDRKFEDFIMAIEERSMENTIIILSADHGESFEHGYFTHGGPFLYEQVTHIPLVIKEPGQKYGTVISDRVEQIDIPATILELAGISVPSWMEGRSLVPFIRGKKLPARPAFSMNFEENRSRGHQIKNGSIAIWEGDDKLIHYLEKGESLLFNLREDPDELNNIYEKEPEAGKRLLSILQDELKLANERILNRNND